MRDFQVLLAQNLGPLGVGETLDVTAHVIEVGPWLRTCEKELTKIAPSEQQITLEDSDSSIWDWLAEHLPSADWRAGTRPNIYPVIIKIYFDDVCAFTGFAAARTVSNNDKDRIIKLNAVDWSYQLVNKYLGAVDPLDDLDPAKNPWARPWPICPANSASASMVAWLAVTPLVPGGYDRVQYTSSDHYPFAGVGDMVTCSISWLPAGKKYKIREIINTVGISWTMYLDGFGQDIWDYVKAHPGTLLTPPPTFTRLGKATTYQDHFSVVKTIQKDTKGMYEVWLDSLDGIQPGDKLTSLGAKDQVTITVVGVDGARGTVRTAEEVSGIYAADDMNTHLENPPTIFWYDEESAASLVMSDARDLITRAVTCQTSGYGVDFSRFTPASLPVAIFQWVPLRAPGAADLSSISDIEPTLSALKVFGGQLLGINWIGSPETGWTETADMAKHACWTDQLLSQPSSLMLFDRAAAPNARPRNRQSFASPGNYGKRLIQVLSEVPNPEVDPIPDPQNGIPLVTIQLLIHDYQLMRRIVIDGAGAGEGSVHTIAAWNGASFDTPVPFIWDPLWVTPVSGCVIPGYPGCLAILDATGAVSVIDLTARTSTSACPVATIAGEWGEMVSTPYAAYVVGGAGYGKVNYTGESVTVDWVTMSSYDTLYPTSFCAIDENSVMVLARYQDTAPGEEVQSSCTYVLQMVASPTIADTALISYDKLFDFIPLSMGAVTDPTGAGRVLGHCGGRLFTISKTLSAYVVERFTPSSMRAMELIEFICQVMGAVAVPDPLGTLHIISREALFSPLQLTIDRVTQSTQNVWENFFTLTRVSSIKDEGVFADALGVLGGEVLEVSQHPLIWTQSGCFAMAQTLNSFFGTPRRSRTESWFHDDPDTAAPWEALDPLQVVQINGESSSWLIYSLSDDKFNGEAKVTLVEIFP